MAKLSAVNRMYKHTYIHIIYYVCVLCVYIICVCTYEKKKNSMCVCTYEHVDRLTKMVHVTHVSGYFVKLLRHVGMHVF